MYTASPDNETTGISRRSFVQIAVGSIVMLPTVTNALLLPSREALADEGGQAAELLGSSSIHIVRTDELGLVVRDVSKGQDVAGLIPGAHVKVTSRYNGVVVEGRTDDKGAIVFDISQLAEDTGKQEMPAVYAFNGTIEISADGYRTFRADLIRLKGATALGIPTQPTQSGIPYPVSASFDEWDVLYTEGDSVDFVSCAGNDANHTIGMRLADCPAGAAITAGVFVNGAQVASASGKAAADGTASLSFVDKFLLPTSTAALPVGSGNSYTVRYTVGSTTYEVPIKPTVSEAPPEAQELQIRKDLELTPFNDATMFVGLSAPEGCPLIGGQLVKMWQPSWYIDFEFDPFGYILFRAQTPELGYISDDGKPDPYKWKFHPKASPKAQFDKQKSKMNDQVAKTFAALAKDGKIKQIGYSSQLYATAQAELMGAATWSAKDKESRGRAQLALKICAGYSLMETFWAGPIPVVIRFSIGLNVTAAGEVGYVSPSVWSFDKYRWDWGSTGFDLQICFPPTLSIGIGIGGVLSVSVKGAFFLTFYLHVGPLPEGYEDLPSPRLRVAGKMLVTLEIEVLFFTDTYKIWESDWPDWYDNWKGKLPQNVSGFASPLKGARLGDALSRAKIITDESLAAVAEFETDGVEGMNPRGTVLTHYQLSKVVNGERTLVANLLLSEDQARKFGGDSQVLLVGQADDSDGSRRTIASGQRGDDGNDLVAGSSVALTAQDDGQAEYVLTPAFNLLGDNDGSSTAEDYQVTMWETELPDATAVGKHDYQPIPLVAPGVLGLGKEQGFLTGADMRIADNILSASHLKLFSAGGNDYVLRLGVVMVNGKPRTRIIAECVGEDERRVLDFRTNIKRDDYFDYDFDISTVHVDGREVINLVVISGPRPEGDSTTLGSAAGKTLFSFLTCRNWWTRGALFTGWTFPESFFDTIGDGGMTYRHRSYSCPQIRHIVGTRDGMKYDQAVVTFLVRASMNEWALMSDDRELTRTGVGLVFFSEYSITADTSGMARMLGITQNAIGDSSLIDAKLSEQAGGWQVLTLKGTEKTYYVLLKIDPCAAIIGGDPQPSVLAAQLASLGEYEGKVSRLVSVPAQGYFLTCVDGKLKRVEVVESGETATLSFTDVGGEPVNINDFGVTSSGDVLFWPATREPGGYVIDEDGNAVERDAEESELNLIAGARIRNGEVGRPMTLCEVSHPMHRIRNFEHSGSYLSFISSTTVNSEKGQGELWYTAVPWVRCAVLDEAEPYATVLAAGDRLAFNLLLRNEGNCYLSGVELSVAEVGHDPFGTMQLYFSEDNTLESSWNPRGDDGKLQNVEYDWALAPGMSARYYAEYVTIPDDWEGDKEVEVFISAVYAVSANQLSAAGALTTQAEDESIEYIPNQRIRGFLSMGETTQANDDEGSYGPADVTVVDSSKAPSDEGSKQGSATKGSPSGSGKSGVPSTGDAIPLAAIAAAGIVGAGAAHRALRSREEDE
ncbi:MAG: carboxypeptidase regulatory-like domain-containing protein [Eggerthellaceae bacterium]|nr:carboxypeptidase regulatory-like domain-containing protein [Eggerthellaceae bacterium]